MKFKTKPFKNSRIETYKSAKRCLNKHFKVERSSLFLDKILRINSESYYRILVFGAGFVDKKFLNSTMEFSTVEN